MEQNDKLKLSEKIAYGLSDLPEAANSIIAAVLMMFYTDSVGLAAGAVGTMLFISQLFDGVSDLIAGSLIDRTRTRWGKARPWLLWLCVPTGLSLALIFWIPVNASQTAKMIYAFCTYNLYVTVLYTIVGLAKVALMPLMTQNGLERGKLAMFSLIFGLGCTVLGISVTFPFVAKLGGGVTAWRIVFALYGFIVSAGLLAAFLLSEEHVESIAAVEDKIADKKSEKYTFIDNVKNFCRNKYFIFAFAMTVFVNTAVQLNNNSQVYFYTYAMNNKMLTSSLSLVGLVPLILSILFLSTPSLRLFGKKGSVYIGCIGQLFGYVLSVIASKNANVPLLAVGLVVRNLSTGPLSVPINTLSADAVDYGEYLTNRRIEGTGSAIVTFSQKLSNGVSVGLVGWVLALTGYVANEMQSAKTIFGIFLMYAYLPMILLALVLLSFKIFYRYDKEEADVMRTLKERKAAAMSKGGSK